MVKNINSILSTVSARLFGVTGKLETGGRSHVVLVSRLRLSTYEKFEGRHFLQEADIKTGSMTKFNATLWVAGFSPFSTGWVEERLRGATAGTSNVLRRCFNRLIADRG